MSPALALGEAAGVVERISELLEVTYRSADLGNLEDPLAETVYILLSKKTQEAMYQELFGELRRVFPTWLDLLRAPRVAVEEVLRPGGLYAQRAAQIQGLLEQVRVYNEARGVGPYSPGGGDLTLDYLRTMTDDEVERVLTSLPGVGPKTARCVMSYSLGREAFAVDTHVHRIFVHLGLAESRGRKLDHDPFQAVVPARLRLPLHVNLVHHGRAVCASSEPRCSDCVLVSWCSTGRERAGRAAPDAPVAIDLFAGAGGLSTGFQDEGFRVALAVEMDRHAAQTYRANHPGVPVIEQDVTKLTGDRIRELAAGANRVDAILAGPPCQGYSAAGKREPTAKSNRLYREVSRLAAELKSEFVVMENVPGVRGVGGHSFVDSILGSLRRRGYSAEHYELNALDFDVPQRRRRMVFMARRSEKGLAPPEPRGTRSEPLSGFLRRRLEDLPALEPGVNAEYMLLADGRRLLNGSTMKHSAPVVAKIAGIRPGKGPLSYRRLDEDAAPTLIAGHRALPVHPWEDRTISVREAARIQGFDDAFVFCGPRAAQPIQVANAVPPPLGAGIARLVRTLWVKKRQPGAKLAVADSTSRD
jgi:DNA (cytosine-5)-methyltransferase 1